MRTLSARLTGFLSILFVFAVLSSGCEKYVKKGELEGGVALTFDDNYIDDWYAQLPMLDSFGAKATFYISSYQSLSHQQRLKLRILQQHGNEIAFHTTSHKNLVEYLKTTSLREVMKKEVLDGLDSMAKDGFYPKSFAYPYGKHNEILDAAMVKVFKSIRVLNGTKDYSQSACNRKGKSFFKGLGIDDDSKSPRVIAGMLESAKNYNNAIVLVAHRVESSLKPNISARKLRFTLKKAKELGLKFYTIEELSR